MYMYMYHRSTLCGCIYVKLLRLHEQCTCLLAILKKFASVNARSDAGESAWACFLSKRLIVRLSIQ